MFRPPSLAGSALIAALAAVPSAAQSPPAAGHDRQAVQAPAPKIEDTLAELRKLVERQQALLEAQSKLLEGLSREVAGLKKQVDDAGAVALTARNEVADLKKQPPAPTVPDAVAQRLAEVEKAVQRVPELTDVVSPGDFPGSLRIPGTDAAMKIGGQARMTMVQTLAALGTDDRFVTSSIPVGDQQAGEDARTVYSPQPSRVNFEIRSPTRIGPMRTFVEADFAGAANTFRLRHAFIQMKRFMFGQNWSTFSDPEAEPIGIDFEGLNAISLFRQPQVRYTWPLKPTVNVALALENPAPDLTGAQGVNLTPDFIARLRWEPEAGHRLRGLLGKAAHVQGAILVRTLRGEATDQPDLTLTTGGFGVNVSGVLVPRWDPDDRVKFAGNVGWGIGKYITDLGTLGGQDAVFNPTDNSLEALQVSSGYFGYERMWRPTFTSAFTYGIVNVQNLDIQPDNALQRTQRTTVNLTWTAIPQADIVVEFLTGVRVNKNGENGASSQIQTGFTYRF
jgi:DcaP outer membrane protein